MADSSGSVTVTDGIRVTVRSEHLPDAAAASPNRFCFSYAIVIANETAQSVRLLRRRWLIIDADGNEEEIAGDGVIGQQPEIPPHGEHSYSSFCVLPTSWGTMEGSYTLCRADGSEFEARIQRFHLFVRQPERVGG